jgi:hypothetical protein
MATLTYRLDGGEPQTWTSELPAADAQLDLIMAQDLAGPAFTLDMWEGADADVTAPPTFRHEHFSD